ncbi:MAG: hypothetical protein ACR2QM_11550 [Longimicrobiales bacterium]
MKIRDWMAVMVLMGIVLGGCGWFEDPTPESVRVVIDGTPGDSLRVVTSTVFVAAENESGQTTVNTLTADTATWVLPVDRMFDIRGDNRFLLLALPGDSTLSIPIQANIQIDARTPFASNVDVTQGNPLLFLFLFNQEVLSDFELI